MRHRSFCLSLGLASAGCALQTTPFVTMETISMEPVPATAGSARFLVRPPVCSNALPIYPESLRELGLPPVTIVAWFRINAQGLLVDVSLTPEASEPAHAYGSLFMAEVERSLATWQCSPAWRLNKPDEEPGQVYVPYTTAYRFDFYVDQAQAAIVEIAAR